MRQLTRGSKVEIVYLNRVLNVEIKDIQFDSIIFVLDDVDISYPIELINFLL